MAAQNLFGDLALDQSVKDLTDTVKLLRRIVGLLEPSGNQDAQGRQRVTIDAILTGLTLSSVGTVTTVTTVSSLTNQAGLYGFDQRNFKQDFRVAYNTGPRANIKQT